MNTSDRDGSRLTVGTQSDGAVKINSHGETSGSGTLLSEGTWHLTGVTHDGSTLKAVLDGNIDYTVTPTSFNWQNIDNWTMGSNLNGGYGLHEEHRIIQKELSPEYLSLNYLNQNNTSTFWGT